MQKERKRERESFAFLPLILNSYRYNYVSGSVEICLHESVSPMFSFEFEIPNSGEASGNQFLPFRMLLMSAVALIAVTTRERERASLLLLKRVDFF